MLDQALVLLLSGMLTVFLVLGLVVILGRTLIYLLNRLDNNPPRTKASPSPRVAEETVAVITAAVEVATAGQGTIIAIESLPQDDDLNL
ncbi:MAG: OadG family protein [Bacteroidota bacterium]